MNKICDEKAIENKIQDFENKIDFEFIPVFSQKSVSLDIVWPFLFTILCFLYLLFIDVIIRTFFSDSWLSQSVFLGAGFLLMGILSWILVRWPFVLRLFFSKKYLKRQTLKSAREIFFLKRLHEIKSQNAFLVYISFFERQVVIIPDERIAIDNLKSLTDQSIKILTTHFKSKNFQQGLEDVIDYLESELKERFPRKQQSDYSNKIIWWAE